MRIDVYICDCCKKETKKRVILTLPVKARGYQEDKQYIDGKKMDICLDCAKRFMDLYYEINDKEG